MMARASNPGLSPPMNLRHRDRASESAAEPGLEAPREVLEVEVERLGVRPSRLEVIRERVVQLLKPLILGGLVDMVDLISSPIFAPVFLPAGMAVGYLFARWLEAPPTWCFLIAALVGVYWVIPFTSPVPMAALIAGFVTIFRPGPMGHEPAAPR